jgi:hypothetical protein
MRFTDMLNATAEDIKKPPVPPAGTYLLKVKKVPEIGDFTAKKSGTEFKTITFLCAVVVAQEVDADALAEFGKIEGYTLRKQFMFSQDPEDVSNTMASEDRLKSFLITLGALADGMSINEALAASVGRDFVGEVTHRLNPENPDQPFAEIGRTYEA